MLAFVLWAAEAASEPATSDDEIRLVMALLIAVAVIALLGTFVYWVRTGDSRSAGDDDSPDDSEATGGDLPGGPEAGDTLG